MEVNAAGELLVLPMTGAHGSRLEGYFYTFLANWEIAHFGVAYPQTVRFRLPGGAILGPDAAWITQERYDALPPEQRARIIEGVPEFIVEIRSRTDDLRPLQDKMEIWMAGGARLGWLIDTRNRQVHVYRAGQPEPQLLEDPETPRWRGCVARLCLSGPSVHLRLGMTFALSMTARVLNGNEIAADLRAEVAVNAGQLASTSGVIPGLAAVLVGDDPASAVYVRNKGRACAEAGIFSEIFYWPGHARQDDLLAFIDRLNADPRFHGILVQLPLPEQLDENTVIQRVDPRKDVDGLHPVNQGRVLQGEPAFLPCTPAGVQQLLLRSGYDPAGKHVVIVGRSNIVGKPLAALLMQRVPGGNATVTVCHTRTRDLPEITRRADILVAAMGVPGAIGADMVRKGAVVVDVGINRVEDPSRRRGYRLVGDVDYQGVAAKAEAITPVPGGIGPMTIAMLLGNTVEAARRTAAALSDALASALHNTDANQ